MSERREAEAGEDPEEVYRRAEAQMRKVGRQQGLGLSSGLAGTQLAPVPLRRARKGAMSFPAVAASRHGACIVKHFDAPRSPVSPLP